MLIEKYINYSMSRFLITFKSVSATQIVKVVPFVISLIKKAGHKSLKNIISQSNVVIRKLSFSYKSTTFQ